MGTWKARTGIFCFFLTVFCTLCASSLGAVKSGSIVICAETGRVHHEKDADVVTHPASLTKMMTLYLTFKGIRDGKLSFSQALPVSKQATLAAPSKLWLKAGSTITVRQAILALVTKSANDAAIVLAEALGNGSEFYFATKMTHQARQLGMSKTVFKNAHGLPNKAQVTTARDMATLSRALYKHFPEYFKFFKEPKFVYKGQVHANHNHLLGKIPGVDGIKTGFINASGFNLAASMVRDNHRIIAVVMGGDSVKSRDTKMAKLLEATHSHLTGKSGPPQSKNAIGDLICAMESSSVQATPIIIRGQNRPAQLIQARYASVDDILDRAERPTPQKRPRKALPLQKRTKIVKKSPPLHAKSGLRRLEMKKPEAKKAVKRGKRKK